MTSTTAAWPALALEAGPTGVEYPSGRLWGNQDNRQSSCYSAGSETRRQSECAAAHAPSHRVLALTSDSTLRRSQMNTIRIEAEEGHLCGIDEAGGTRRPPESAVEGPFRNAYCERRLCSGLARGPSILCRGRSSWPAACTWRWASRWAISMVSARPSPGPSDREGAISSPAGLPGSQ
jgi:hypothetical protein